MKDIIKKILKENEDEFNWADELNTDEFEKNVKQSFIDLNQQYDIQGLELFTMLVNSGVKSIEKLNEIGEFIYNEVDGFSSREYERGRYDGLDDCTCDGCYDDFVYYETAEKEKDEAREDGYNDGYDTAKTELESEIDELKSRIEELESQLNENINKKKRL
jgi:hypothetical protein